MGLSQKIYCAGLLLGSLTSVANAQTACRGQIEAIQSRAGADVPENFMPDPYLDSLGSLVAVRTSFSSGRFVALCSLSKSLDTDSNVSVDVSNLETSQGVPQSTLDSLLESVTSMYVTPELCEHWQASVQLAMVMEYDIELEYAENSIGSCDELTATDAVLPIRLSVER